MRHRVSASCTVAMAGALLLAGACGKSSPSSPSTSTTTTSTGTSNRTITISNNSVSPKTITVAPGSRVTFVNSDSRNHQMNSDPHPDHIGPEACPEINDVGFLAPGQARETGNLNQTRTCTYHDHLQDTNANLRGTIVVQ